MAALRMEFHCHTIYSGDSLTKVEALLAACREKGIDRVVITDHNTIEGARAAREIDPERVVIGEEIMTQKGELLAAFVAEEIPEGLPALEAIDRLREQNAFISVSHPFDRLRSGSWERADLERIAPLVDAIEIFNARCFSMRFNDVAREFAAAHSLPGTVGSDAHAAFELGTATATMPDFEDAAGLRAALRHAEYRVALSKPWVRLVSRYATLRKKLG